MLSERLEETPVKFDLTSFIAAIAFSLQISPTYAGFDYEYTDHLKSGWHCPYFVDKAAGKVMPAFGNSTPDAVAEECLSVLSKEKAIALATRVKREVRFGGYVTNNEDIIGSVALACYTGSIDSDNKYVSSEERLRRYKALIDLYDGDETNTRRIKNAFNFANINLRDRYPLDTEGYHRVSICGAMIKKGKL